MNKGVSCLCLTYGRPSLLEEAIESFHRQRWDGPKELIIVNDHLDQELVYTHDEVVIINLKKRIRTLGEKRNFCASVARYNYLLVWDDDDIHLPWRIEETMKVLHEGHFYKCPKIWIMNEDKLEAKPARADLHYHGACGYSRHLFEVLSGYRFINGGEDQDFERRMKLDSRLNKYWGVTGLPLNRLYYIYRRSNNRYVASGCLDLREIQPQAIKGEHSLRPHWDMDYCKEVSRQIERLQSGE